MGLMPNETKRSMPHIIPTAVPHIRVASAEIIRGKDRRRGNVNDDLTWRDELLADRIAWKDCVLLLIYSQSSRGLSEQPSQRLVQLTEFDLQMSDRKTLSHWRVSLFYRRRCSVCSLVSAKVSIYALTRRGTCLAVLIELAGALSASSLGEPK